MIPDAINIEKGVPIPNKTRVYGKWVKLFKSMEVGDSFVIPVKYRGSVGTCAKRIGVKIQTQTIGDTEVRVWRTA